MISSKIRKLSWSLDGHTRDHSCPTVYESSDFKGMDVNDFLRSKYVIIRVETNVGHMN